MQCTIIDLRQAIQAWQLEQQACWDDDSETLETRWATSKLIQRQWHNCEQWNLERLMLGVKEREKHRKNQG